MDVARVLQTFCLGAICGALVAAIRVRDSDYERFAKEQKEEHADRCCFEETRPCAFGPGVIGIQRCGIGLRWSDVTCEPDPRYRVTEERPR